MKQGKLIIFSAPSGSGKTTIVKHLLEQNFNMHFSISATSRPPREGEIHEKDYYFISPEDFVKKIAAGEFIEWEEVYENRHYGTLKSCVDKLLQEGKNVVFDVDVVGGINIKKQYGDQALSIFVQPPSIEVLEIRLRSRNTDTDEDINNRLKKAAWEMDFAKQFDVVLINDKLQESLRSAEKILTEFLEQ